MDLISKKMEIGAENPILRKKSEHIKKFDKNLSRLIRDMKDTMLLHKGIGIAAPQVGQNIRVIVVKLHHVIVAMINPVLVQSSSEKVIAEEGCLSLPGVFKKVERSKQITVKFLDKKGKSQVLQLEDLNARIVQHEIDHLNGILIIDKATDEKTDVKIKVEF